jgi:uncharacterized membrane protein HdeD (DUF308 family)
MRNGDQPVEPSDREAAIAAGGPAPQRPPSAVVLIVGIVLVLVGSWGTYVAISEHKTTPYTLGPILLGMGIIAIKRYREGRKARPR